MAEFAISQEYLRQEILLILQDFHFGGTGTNIGNFSGSSVGGGSV
jgi:hypothetical protein